MTCHGLLYTPTCTGVRQHVTAPERLQNWYQLLPDVHGLISDAKALQMSAVGGRFDAPKTPTTGTVRWRVMPIYHLRLLLDTISRTGMAFAVSAEYVPATVCQYDAHLAILYISNHHNTPHLYLFVKISFSHLSITTAFTWTVTNTTHFLNSFHDSMTVTTPTSTVQHT